MIETLSDQQVEEVLKTQLVGRLGCQADGVVYVVPVSYAYDGECIYVHTFEGMKMQTMRKNPAVCFEVDTMHNMADWQSVIAWGQFEELTDPALRNQGLKFLMNRILPPITSETVELSPDWPFEPKNLNEIKGIVFRVRLSKKTGRYEKKEVVSFFAP